ncbi:uncharacterized protein LOC114326447 [Diabrotica virgifera virgifera]|uniref:Uncharacterized protein n=1 Tax=Diabrotica virgifera virgifera TaxID=50390 RepID=A0ABM5IDT1_DIAVI|nr:uncharacterized protein LOC114326447 [Diabrotica virgifera virgifera]XP_050512749.1 uncharacterized protein LOC114326447 [Diabrotica virgifera virgifera]XP_050512750.1 uncharacterized protein LOC114326447 [Diabrotica virgifera virgifera]XP_050512751.1 uncharacterized protein LOC114326447 [Diabrotica virgifera virgifera]XP_050512752.1 uncharacterized protein LOC114326447 [Diabrotica virgifera virgifera]
MVEKYILVMDMCKFVILLVLYFSSCSCYPLNAKPLNERAPDLTWEAWLLVDDQNQNKQLSDGVLRRRITPKSVFIAPTFSPESLPACAEGYSSDHLGRCIKIIKLDQAAQYEFLIAKLKEKFTPVDYDDDYYDEDLPTPGPFQVNIPLDTQSDQGDDTIEESDVAIIVSPTKPQYTIQKGNVGKRDGDTADTADQNLQEEQLKHLAETTTTTILPPTEKLTTYLTQTTDGLTETTEPITSTTTISTTIADTTWNTDWTTETKMTTSSPKPVDSVDSVSEANKVRFPDDAELKTHVRFPSAPGAEATQIPPSVNIDPRSLDTRQSDEPIVDFDLINFREPQPQENNSNRRNREKNNGLFFLPPRWTDSTYQRPVVLRFSRKHAYLDMEQFKKPNYYRSIPTDDFAYLFKFKHKQSDQR